MDIGGRISSLRKKRNLTQEELAKKIGISRAALSHYEKNRREPDYEVLERFASFFEVTTDYLIGRSEDPDLTESEEQEITNNVREIMKEIESLPPNMRRQAEEDLLKRARELKIILNPDDHQRS